MPSVMMLIPTYSEAFDLPGVARLFHREQAEGLGAGREPRSPLEASRRAVARSSSCAGRFQTVEGIRSLRMTGLVE